MVTCGKDNSLAAGELFTMFWRSLISCNSVRDEGLLLGALLCWGVLSIARFRVKYKLCKAVQAVRISCIINVYLSNSPLPSNASLTLSPGINAPRSTVSVVKINGKWINAPRSTVGRSTVGRSTVSGSTVSGLTVGIIFRQCYLIYFLLFNILSVICLHQCPVFDITPEKQQLPWSIDGC